MNTGTWVKILNTMPGQDPWFMGQIGVVIEDVSDLYMHLYSSRVRMISNTGNTILLCPNVYLGEYIPTEREIQRYALMVMKYV